MCFIINTLDFMTDTFAIDLLESLILDYFTKM